MKNRQSKYLTLFLILSGIFTALIPVYVYAQETDFELPQGGVLTIEGEDFTFEQVSIVEGENMVIQERAIWEGGVRAFFTTEDGDVILETGHIEAVFDGRDITRLEAGPEVLFTGLNGRAFFECHDVLIDFPTSTAGQDIYSGICHDVHGYYLADAYQLGLEGDDQYEINFTAEVVRLEPAGAVLESPCLSLGNLDDPDVAILSRQIDAIIGLHPDTGQREVLGARLDNVSVKLFGNRLNLLPFPVWRGFVPSHDPGWRTPIPGLGWEGDEGPRIDLRQTYNFNLDSFNGGPRVVFRLDSFPFARSYPEIFVDGGFGDFYFEARGGYRREEDREGDPVPTRAEPEISLGLNRVRLGESGFGFRAKTFWGHMRDMGDGPDLDRWGYRARLDHPGVKIGEFKLSGEVEFRDYYFEGGDNFQFLDGLVSLRYVDPPHWGASLIYRKVYEWGDTPFRFDVPQLNEELGLREQSRFNRRWGAGFDWAWDFGEDDYERQECHLTYIFDSFQVSAGWDFADDTAKLYFALPGSLK